MKHEDTHAEHDPVMDEITSRLRTEPVPPIPDELFQATFTDLKTNQDSIASNKRLGWFEISCMAGAAAVLVAVGWMSLIWMGSTDPPDRRADHEGVESVDEPQLAGRTDVIVKNLASLEPFADLEQEIREMEKELASLKREATMLDAYRKANSLLANK